MIPWTHARSAILLLATATVVAGCSSDVPVEYEYPTKQYGRPTYEKSESVFGPDGLDLAKIGEQPQGTGTGTGIAVNAFLWRASLDTLSFLPLASADPFGGVIISEWYQPPESGTERFKITIYILDRALRSDGVRANVFRQERRGGADWVDAVVDPGLGKELEDAILTRARQIRIEQAAVN